MGWEVRDGALFCNTADVHFGPECANEAEAYDLGNECCEPYRDPRACSHLLLCLELKRLRGESIAGKFVLTFTSYAGEELGSSGLLTYEECRGWALRLADKKFGRFSISWPAVEVTQ